MRRFVKRLRRFRARETPNSLIQTSGKRVRRTAVIGTVEQYPTKDLAQAAVNGLRLCINEDRNRQREQRIPVADLIDQHIAPGDAIWLLPFARATGVAIHYDAQAQQNLGIDKSRTDTSNIISNCKRQRKHTVDGSSP